jgi:hypothetical protein
MTIHSRKYPFTKQLSGRPSSGGRRSIHFAICLAIALLAVAASSAAAQDTPRASLANAEQAISTQHLPLISVHASFTVSGHGGFLFNEDLFVARDGASTGNLSSYGFDEGVGRWDQISSSGTGSAADFSALVTAIQVDRAISQRGNCAIAVQESDGVDDGVVGTYEIRWYALQAPRQNVFQVSFAGAGNKAPACPAEVSDLVKAIEVYARNTGLSVSGFVTPQD